MPAAHTVLATTNKCLAQNNKKTLSSLKYTFGRGLVPNGGYDVRLKRTIIYAEALR
jgi:hypothetical protein